MSDNSYLVRFIRRDGSADEEYYYGSYYDAKEHFSTFDENDEDDRELYTSIEFIEVDWLNRQNKELDCISFEEG